MAAAAELVEDKAEIPVLHGMSRLCPAVVTDDKHPFLTVFPAEAVYRLPLSLVSEIFTDDRLYRYHTRRESEGVSRDLRMGFITSTAFPFHCASI